jgi:hypothetical protein
MCGMLIEILKIATVVYVVFILMSPGMILHFYARLIDRIPYDWLYKPIGGCLICFGGQAGLWYYLISHWSVYNLFDHIVFIAGVILAVMALDKLIDYE